MSYQTAFFWCKLLFALMQLLLYRYLRNGSENHLRALIVNEEGYDKDERAESIIAIYH